MARTARRVPTSNIYTILVFAAALALLIAIGYVWYRSTQVFPNQSPLSPKAPAIGVAALLPPHR